MPKTLKNATRTIRFFMVRDKSFSRNGKNDSHASYFSMNEMYIATPKIKVCPMLAANAPANESSRPQIEAPRESASALIGIKRAGTATVIGGQSFAKKFALSNVSTLPS